ncbi:MAG: hypothetical protein ISR59_13125 [Anaerolineales bacterium]|nr:hypothetical protein [Anaerolineales bacterium]
MLSGPFTKKAPAAVVDKEREKLMGYKETADLAEAYIREVDSNLK